MDLGLCRGKYETMITNKDEKVSMNVNFQGNEIKSSYVKVDMTSTCSQSDGDNSPPSSDDRPQMK